MNKKAAIWIIFVFAFTSCLPKHEIVRQGGNRPQVPSQTRAAGRAADQGTDQHADRDAARQSGQTVGKDAGPVSPPGIGAGAVLKPGTSLAGLNYIDRYRQIAIEEMDLHGIPASIKLAQGILESGNGSSRLAVEANNHFGIKCTGDWPGGRTYQDDDAENDCFRVYEHAEQSFRDHSQFLLRRRYEKLFTLDRTDYRAWATGLKEAGYATNPRYAELLIDLIERYELYQYDQTGAENKVVANSSSSVTTTPPVTKGPVTMKIHEVTAGDTAAGIASRYGLSVQQLLTINGLRSQDLHLGQLLIVSN